jgi:hypothetical protein
MSNRKRFISLTLVFAFAAAAMVVSGLVALPDAVFGQVGKKTAAPRSQQDRKALARRPAPSGTIKDRLGEDDGYALALFFSADVHGNLEVCGCPIYPLGGVARRMGYINAFRRRSPDAAVLTADAGYIFSDDVNAGGSELRADARVMNEWIVRANDIMPLDVVNLSYRDLTYARELLRADARLKPEKSRIISANVKAKDAALVNPAPWVIKTVTAPRLKQPLRIAFIGLTDLPPADEKDRVEASGFTIEDPFAAAAAAVAEVRDKADVTVIVGYLKLTTTNRVAAQNEDLDVIISSDGRGLVPDPKQINNALVLFASRETKHLGELRFYTDAEGIVDRFTARYVELDEVIEDDPEMARVTVEARTEIGRTQLRMAEEEALNYKAPDNSPYVTSETCGKCHEAEYRIWEKSRHAHAFEALETKQRVFDAACVGCHSIGFQNEGFVNIRVTPQFAGVGCEACHGPGAEHVKAPRAGNYHTPAAPGSCVLCHDRDNSPDFNFRKYWPVVAHSNSLKPPPARRGGVRRERGRRGN